MVQRFRSMVEYRIGHYRCGGKLFTVKQTFSHAIVYSNWTYKRLRETHMCVLTSSSIDAEVSLEKTSKSVDTFSRITLKL